MAVLAALAAGPTVVISQQMPNKNRGKIRRIDKNFAVTDVTNSSWKRADKISISTYWNGENAPAGRSFTARLLWSDTHLYVLFEAQQVEPLVISDNPVLTSKSMNLWDRDVCEIFLAPDRREPRKYFEFEVAPTGEWLDVALDLTSGKRVSNWNYDSEMEAAAKMNMDHVTLALRVPWTAFGKKPKAGEIWLGNLLRCIGKDPDRGYLAWSPTMTKEPAFHVPEKFGEFEFVN
jgi:hypothetical protein